jgi:hypothetical protein
VVGAHPALGAWTVEGGVRSGDEVQLDGVAIEYKWHDGSSWEERGNRKLHLPEANDVDATLTLTVMDRAARFPAGPKPAPAPAPTAVPPTPAPERQHREEPRREERRELPADSSFPGAFSARVDGGPPQWYRDGVVYSIQTLGFCDCEGPPSHFEYGERLARLIDDGWLDHVSRLGCTVLYLGPLMKTSEELGHGYDTADYFEVDPRLGTMATLRRVVEAAHALQIRVIVDGVFNHTGRDHFAARDVLQRGSQSQYWSGGRERNRREFPLSPFPRVVGACSAAPLALVQCVLYAVLHSRSTSRVK